MSRAARTVFVFGVYLVGVAVTLAAAPNLLLGLLGIPAAHEPWIRVLGIVVGALATYYIVAARGDFVPFFKASVWVRVLVLVAFCGLVALSWAPAAIIGFGVIDSLGGLWTWLALRPQPR